MDDDNKILEIKSRLGNCEVCNINPAKYTCPKCELKTCCLQCVNIHKKELDCDGIRNKVKFVPIQKYTNNDLQDDFKLLEQISDSLFKYKRDPLKKCGTMYNKLPFPLHMIRKYSHQRKIILKFLPKLFTKHKINTSCVHKNKLFWRIEWIFVSSNIKLVDEKIEDTTSTNSVLKNHLEDPKLEFYKAAGMNGILILIKDDNLNKYYILDLHLSISENLKNKTIIEFPVFYVIFAYEKDMFDIADELSLNNNNNEDKCNANEIECLDIKDDSLIEDEDLKEDNNININNTIDTNVQNESINKENEDIEFCNNDVQCIEENYMNYSETNNTSLINYEFDY